MSGVIHRVSPVALLLKSAALPIELKALAHAGVYRTIVAESDPDSADPVPSASASTCSRRREAREHCEVDLTA
ncbi:hypothetical protein SAT01_06920 [Sinomonas atrocyanea]|nr:hypothetical protein SAT01_06920 [Sinomonas atrocyanea]GGG69717.1 hypothetical protein GCM10007172_22330 [Sinomonas atrocyanea]